MNDTVQAPRRLTDRIFGAALVLIGLAVGAEASTFNVAFPTDPVGPKALPYLSALVFLAAGVRLLARPDANPRWPERPTLLRMTGATAAFGAYAALIAPLGFVVATTTTVAVLSLLFGAPWKKAVGAALTLSVALWYLFVWVLGLQLPLGSAWEALWKP